MVRGQLTIAASDEGTLEALRFAGELDVDRVWAVEDCRHVSGRWERLTESSRRSVREPGKSDPIDATRPVRQARRFPSATGSRSSPAAESIRRGSTSPRSGVAPVRRQRTSGERRRGIV
jgi:transposase